MAFQISWEMMGLFLMALSLLTFFGIFHLFLFLISHIDFFFKEEKISALTRMARYVGHQPAKRRVAS